MFSLTIYQKFLNIIKVLFSFLLLIRKGHGDVAAFFRVTAAKSSLLDGQRPGPGMSCQLIAGPLLMAVAATQGANCTLGATLGFSILL